MRGLKQRQYQMQQAMYGVASFTDAWIETALGMNVGEYIQSHLLQMRGLKLIVASSAGFP